MIISDAVRWWYARGWSWAAQQFFVVYTKKAIDFFSISDLLKTLFSPFRQDSMNTQNAPIGVKLQALGGNIISRFFGFFIRIVLIITGLLSILAGFITGLAAVIIWPLIPAAPLVSIILMLLKVGI